MESSARLYRIRRTVWIGLYAALLLAGCTISLGITNSPPTPDQCGPGRSMCWHGRGHSAAQARLMMPTRNSATTAPAVATMKPPNQPPPALCSLFSASGRPNAIVQTPLSNFIGEMRTRQ